MVLTDRSGHVDIDFVIDRAVGYDGLCARDKMLARKDVFERTKEPVKGVYGGWFSRKKGCWEYVREPRGIVGGRVIFSSRGSMEGVFEPGAYDIQGKLPLGWPFAITPAVLLISREGSKFDVLCELKNQENEDASYVRGKWQKIARGSFNISSHVEGTPLKNLDLVDFPDNSGRLNLY